MNQIIDQSHEKKEGAGADDHPTVGRVWNQCEVNANYGKPNRDATDRRRRILVPAVDLGTRHKTLAPRERTHHRRQRQRQNE